MFFFIKYLKQLYNEFIRLKVVNTFEFGITT